MTTPPLHRESPFGSAAQDLLRLGTTGSSGEVVVRCGRGLWLGIVDPLQPGALDDATRGVCEACLRQQLAGASEGDDLMSMVERVSRAIGEVLAQVTSTPAPGVAVQLAHVLDQRVRMAWTAQGAAYLVRDGDVVGVAEGTRAVGGDAAVRVPYVAQRIRAIDGLRGSMRTGLHVVPFAWVMRTGDRLVLVPHTLSARFQRADLVTQGDTAGAFRVTPLGYPAVRKYLQSRGYPVDGF